MTTRIVVGLFESVGFARDARNRLHTEGVPEEDCSIQVLKEIGPVPRTSEPELAALEFDPLVLGDVRETFARFIRNGETAVLVRTESAAEAEYARDILRLFAPIAIEEFEVDPVA